MDFEQGFTLLRELGRTAQGQFLPADALVAIHWTHRVGALVTLCAVGSVVWTLWRTPSAGWHAVVLGGLLLLQVATGLANVVLHWPLAAALLHTAGAAALLAVLTSALARAHLSSESLRTSSMTPSPRLAGHRLT